MTLRGTAAPMFGRSSRARGFLVATLVWMSALVMMPVVPLASESGGRTVVVAFAGNHLVGSGGPPLRCRRGRR